MHQTSSKLGTRPHAHVDHVAVRPLLARRDGVARDRPRRQVRAALAVGSLTVEEDGVVVVCWLTVELVVVVVVSTGGVGGGASAPDGSSRAIAPTAGDGRNFIEHLPNGDGRTKP